MKNIISAEDFYLRGREDQDSFEEMLIDFAKMHVKAALEAAAEDAWLEDGCDTHGVEIDKDTIINAYPLTNIK